MLKNKYWIGFLILILSCQVGPRKIEYGEDACTFCKMTIVDQRHAAQLVTEKGKNYVFDAIECMVQYQKQEENIYRFQLVADYLNPGNLIPVGEATFLISRSIPSPMGAYLSAFANSEQLNALPESREGEIYDWVALQQVIPAK